MMTGVVHGADEFPGLAPGAIKMFAFGVLGMSPSHSINVTSQILSDSVNVTPSGQGISPSRSVKMSPLV